MTPSPEQEGKPRYCFVPTGALWGSGTGVDVYLRTKTLPLPSPLPLAVEGANVQLRRLRHHVPSRLALHREIHTLRPAQLPGSG
jgi:hypothetical protein